ncbi:MAG TPA: prepilin peptidase [Planctomycetes bacterium]|nr:prepilin peptidase [Planctomycetota bacterium]HIJ70315.1 prepilin peptidase [Planctomycetota bacterium]
MPLELICLIFVFAYGSCIGSFLNVVIYRMPRDKSLTTPPSTCPACDRRIRFYDNIPLVSWLLLGAKCRYCKTRISPRYFVIELLTALIFVAVFVLYFIVEYRRLGIEADTGVGMFLAGGWLVYLNAVVLLAGLLAASAIDLELWVIPLQVCWFITVVGLITASVGVYVIDPAVVWTYKLWPSASTRTAVMTLGAAAGLIISLVLLWAGVIKRSYQSESDQKSPRQDRPDYPHRLEVLKEVLFLLPIILCSTGALWLTQHSSLAGGWWTKFSQVPAIAGFLGSLSGYFAGCAVVWATRILGTLGFGKEAMGMGDVHLMGAAGAVIGPVFVVIAFFIAPFFGLIWAGFQMLFKKTRQIPYGPFLSLAVFTVMIFHDWFRDYIAGLYLYY